MKLVQSNVKPIIWQDTKLLVLDQRLLPYEKKYLELTSYKEVISAIKDMILRGAPLIGITAAYGMALAAREFSDVEKLKKIGEEIKQSRPTAINLKWAIDLILNDVCHSERSEESINGMRSFASAQDDNQRKKKIIETITKRAIWIHEDDANRCQKISEFGLEVIQKIISVETRRGASLLTICNTGALATGEIGTAFGVILTAYKNDPSIEVFIAETRPRQQGARLTTFEFVENNIECTLVSDTACGYLMQRKEIDLVITGADRIAANGDTANKIGTYQLAVLAKENNIPFYIAAPLSTFDLSCKSGNEIPIEERDEKEVTEINRKLICAKGIKVRNPAFDVTPAKYIAGIITEEGILKGDYKEEIQRVFNRVIVV